MELKTITPQEAVGYMENNLRALKNAGVEIYSILDIGAAHGHFSHFAQTIWPNSTITAIECNPKDEHFLKNTNWDVIYKCLGDKSCTKIFYTNPAEPVGGGSSFYLENTEHYTQAIKEEKEIVTLDSLNLGYYDLIKIDTQGSELDIIKGGEKTVKNARFLLLELSFLDYNKNAPLIDDVLTYTRQLGFRMLDTFGPVSGGHWYAHRKVQADVLLVKEDDELLQMPMV